VVDALLVLVLVRLAATLVHAFLCHFNARLHPKIGVALKQTRLLYTLDSCLSSCYVRIFWKLKGE
jgi:hypothetical protein